MTKEEYILHIKYFSNAFFEVADMFKKLKGDNPAFSYSSMILGTEMYICRNAKTWSLYKMGCNKPCRYLRDGHYNHAYSDLLKAFIDALEEDEENVAI